MTDTKAGRALLAEPSVLLLMDGDEIIGLNEGELEMQTDAIEREAKQQERERIREEFRKAGMLILDRRIDAILTEPSE